MNSFDIEMAVARFMNYRQNIIIPNVSWGFLANHEADMLVVRPSGFCAEVEIKVSRADIKADLGKSHRHMDCRIKELFFAVPYTLEDCEHIPEGAGIISVKPPGRCKIIRRKIWNSNARKLTAEEINKLLHLGTMRMWNLKEILIAKRDDRRDQSIQFYAKRITALQEAQSSMRDPERTVVCNILANGRAAP